MTVTDPTTTPQPTVAIRSIAQASKASSEHTLPTSPPQQSWHHTATAKQQAREASLLSEARLSQLFSGDTLDKDADCSGLPAKLLSSEEAAIISKPAHVLAQEIASRRLTSYQVTLAFCRAATIAQDATNCLTEVCFQEALARARYLDDHQLKHDGAVLGRLHGVPVSVKDHIDVQGMDGPSGFVGWCGQCVAETNALAVQCLVEQGAVIYCKTANPQSLLSIETNNNIYGRTLNPHNRTLSPGGSSGGEGALIAMRGSVLGVGTDIAGSIRIPALWSGLYGLRPTVGRMPHSGLRGPHTGMDTIVGVVGPLATCAEDLALFCSAILERQPWRREPQVLTLPWKKEEEVAFAAERKLRIGVMFDDGLCAVHPPILRAMHKTTAALTAAGHTIVPWKPVLAQESLDVLFTACLQDRGEEYLEHLALSGEPPVPLIKWLLSDQAPPRSLTSPREVWDLNIRRDTIKATALAQWASLDLDFILCPGAPTLAPRHDQSRHWSYTSMWNVVDWPGVVFPLGRYDSAEESKDNGIYEKEQEQDGKGKTSRYPPHPPRNTTEAHVMDEWRPEWYRHAPIGLQLVGQKMQEEELLQGLKVVEAALALAGGGGV